MYSLSLTSLIGLPTKRLVHNFQSPPSRRRAAVIRGAAPGAVVRPTLQVSLALVVPVAVALALLAVSRDPLTAARVRSVARVAAEVVVAADKITRAIGVKLAALALISLGLPAAKCPKFYRFSLVNWEIHTQAPTCKCHGCKLIPLVSSKLAWDGTD